MGRKKHKNYGYNQLVIKYSTVQNALRDLVTEKRKKDAKLKIPAGYLSAAMFTVYVKRNNPKYC
jgi:hypothetical protein